MSLAMIAVKPEGFCHLEAILATTLFGARPTEKVKRDHVQQEMHPVGMQESRSDQPVILFAGQDLWNREQVFVAEKRVAKSDEGTQNGQPDDDQGGNGGRFVHETTSWFRPRARAIPFSG